MALVLTVCTGNVCRSPAAAHLLAPALDGIEVASAGTDALVGQPIPDQMVDLLGIDGIAATHHAARQLTREMLEEATLVITMTEAQRKAVTDLGVGAGPRTFTLAQVAAAGMTHAPLIGQTVADRIADVPRAISGHRRVLQRYRLRDVPDPYMKSDQMYAAAYALIRTATEQIARWVDAEATERSAFTVA